MTEVKVRLSMSVPGAQMLSSQECDKNPKKFYNVESLTIKKGKNSKERLKIKTRKCRLVKQCINISKEAYDFMTAPDQPPTKQFSKKVYLTKIVGKRKDGKLKKEVVESTLWAQMSTVKRLNWYMNSIAESLGAVGYTFEVLED